MSEKYSSEFYENSALDFDRTLIDEEVTTKKTRYPDGLLSSPISDGLIKRLSPFIEGKTDKDAKKTIKDFMREHSHNKIVMYSGFYGILRSILNSGQDLTGFKRAKTSDTAEIVRIIESDDSELLDDIRSGLSLSNDVVNSIQDFINPTDVPYPRSTLKLSQISATTRTWQKRQIAWKKVVETARRSQGLNTKENIKIFRPSPVKFLCLNSIILIICFKASWFVTYEQLLMYLDICTQRTNIYLAADLGLHRLVPSRLRHVITRMIEIQEKALQLYDNDGYAISKGIEALTKTYLTDLSEGDILFPTSFWRTVEKIEKKERKLKGLVTITQEMVNLVRETRDENETAELFGLIKISGHPQVSAPKSAVSMAKEAQGWGGIGGGALKRFERSMKYCILHGYVEKTGEWPPFKNAPAQGTRLYQLYSKKGTSFNITSFDMSDLDDVRFGKIIDFDYSEDYLQFLDDKAINPGKAATPQFWFGGSKTETRRMLLKVLKEDKIDIIEICKDLDKMGDLDDELIIWLSEKERELKPEARGFAVTGLRRRLYHSICEYNLGKLMKVLFPQSSMVDSDAELKTKLAQMAKTAATHDRTAVVDCDFSRWNLKMRKTLVDTAAIILEDLFDTPGRFTKKHDFFEKCIWVMCSRHYLPKGASPDKHINEWPESDLLWKNHKGGAEGICQKLWTIVTIGMIYTSLAGLVDFYLLGQGDNQVLILNFKSKDEKVVTLRKALARMDILTQWLGHELKPDECQDSSNVLLYSKHIYYKGVYLPYVLKMLARQGHVSDYDAPTVHDVFLSSTGTAVSIADRLDVPIDALIWFYVSCIKELRFRTWKEDISLGERRSIEDTLSNKRLLRFTLTLPSTFGGFSVPTLNTCFCRGDVDPVTWDITWIKAVGKVVPQLVGLVKLNLAGKFISEKPDRTRLLEDPYSLPIFKPVDMIRLITSEVETSLPGYTNNLDIKPLISLSCRDEGDRLTDYLSTLRPLYPEIATSIAESSLQGLRSHILAKFKKSRTIVDVASSGSYIQRIWKSNEAMWLSVEDKFKESSKIEGSILDRRSYDLAETIRNFWFRDEDHPFGIPRMMEGVSSECPLDHKIVPGLHPDAVNIIFSTPRSDCLTTIGRCSPYFGPKTRQKRNDKGMKVYTESRTGLDIKRLMLISSQIKAGGPLKNLIDDIVRSRTPWDPDLLRLVYPDVEGGSALHRTDNIAGKHFGGTSNRSFSTHAIFSTDRSGVDGQDDYAVIFQEWFLTMMTLAQIWCKLSPSSEETATLSLVTRVKDYQPFSNMIPQCEYTTINWPDIRGNKLGYMTNLQVTFLDSFSIGDTLPVVSADKLTNREILTGWLLTRLLRGSISKIVRDAAEGQFRTSEELDVKEASIMGPDAILDSGSLLTLILATWTSFEIMGNTYSGDVYKSQLYKMSALVAQVLGRSVLLHTWAKDKIIIENRLYLSSGKNGYLRYLNRLSAYLAQSSKRYMNFDKFCITRIPMFQDADSSPTLILRAIMTVLVTLMDASVTKQYGTHTKLGRDLMATMRVDVKNFVPYRHLVTGHILNKIEDFNIERNDRDRLRELRCKKFVSDNIVAVRTSPNQAMRTRRLVKKYNPLKANRDILENLIPLSPIEYRIDTIRGETGGGSSCRVEERSQLTIKIDALLRSISRCFGTESTVGSLFSAIPIKSSKCLCIGIGEGGLPAYLTSSGINVIAVELTSDIPMVSHRLATYVPPEVIRSGNPDFFEWSQGFMSCSNDWTNRDIQKRILDATDVDLIIVDIQLGSHTYSFDDLVPISPTYTNMLIRCYLSDDEIKLWLSKLKNVRPEVYIPGFGSEYERKETIIYFEYNKPLRSGNQLEVTIKFVDKKYLSISSSNHLIYKDDIARIILEPFGLSPNSAGLNTSDVKEARRFYLNLNRYENPVRYWYTTQMMEVLKLIEVYDKIRDPNLLIIGLYEYTPPENVRYQSVVSLVYRFLVHKYGYPEAVYMQCYNLLMKRYGGLEIKRD